MDLLKVVSKLLELDFHSIKGWCPFEKAILMANLVLSTKASLCVELGVFGGRSLLPMALAGGPGCRVIGIDAWAQEASLEGENTTATTQWWSRLDYDSLYSYTQTRMISAGVPHVELWRSKSRDVAHMFKENSIDILHQDSNHSEQISCEEVELYWNKVALGGLWVFDDTHWDTTQKAQSLLLSKGYSLVHTHEYREDNVLKSWKVFRRTYLS